MNSVTEKKLTCEDLAKAYVMAGDIISVVAISISTKWGIPCEVVLQPLMTDAAIDTVANKYARYVWDGVDPIEAGVIVAAWLMDLTKETLGKALSEC